MKNLYFIIFFSFNICFIHSQITYEYSDNFTAICDDNYISNYDSPISTYIQNDSIIISQEFSNQCCANFVLEISKITNDTVYIRFSDTSLLVCSCLCNFKIKINAGVRTSDSLTIIYNGNNYKINTQEFAPIGAEWFYSEHNGGLSPTNSEYVIYKSIKDTIILNQLSKKIERKYYKYNGKILLLSPHYISQKADSVFLYNPHENEFDKLYVFNASKNDTLTLKIPFDYLSFSNGKTTYRLVVDSVITETYNNIEFRKYKLNDLDGFNWISGWYMDRLGGLDWFLPRGIILPEAGGPIRCYHDEEVDIKLVDYNCEYRNITGLEPTLSEKILVYPNPTTNSFIIKTIEKIYAIDIYNDSGKWLFNTNDMVIELSNFPTGTYWIKIRTDKGTSTKQILKF